MTISRQQFAARELRTLYQLGAIGDRSDRQLLEQFNTGGPEAAELAFAALVERHGPMVLGVCRSLLQNPHDAQDVFQATFLVLLRKAHALWIRDSLGPWLFRVARRLAVRVQVASRRRRALERRLADSKAPPISEVAGRDPLPALLLLHEEIDRLPERYRVPVILCHLEGQSHDLVARTLRVPVGTLKSRLFRAREILRGRLSRRGLAFSTALLSAGMASRAEAAALSISLFTPLLRAAARTGLMEAGKSGLLSPNTVHLVQEASKTMLLTRVKLSAAVALLAGVLAAGVFAQQGPGRDSGAEPIAVGKKSSTGPAVSGGDAAAPAPAYVRRSRKMIVERLEQELASARQRLDRTTRKAGSQPAGQGMMGGTARRRRRSDPELLRAQKIVDTLEGLLSRVDTVLVEAVDEFPTLFDFSTIAEDADGERDLDVAQNAPRKAFDSPDVDLRVSESQRIVAVGETTTFQIRLRNYGGNAATNLLVNATITNNLELQFAKGPSDVKVMISPDKKSLKFDAIKELKPGIELELEIQVKAAGESPRLATCRVALSYDGISEGYEDMAGVKVVAASSFGSSGRSAGRTASVNPPEKAKSAPAAQKPDVAASGPPYDEHSLARSAENLEWARKMHEKGYVSKGQYEADRAAYLALKARIDADIVRAEERVEWAKKMFDKGYVSRAQYDAELLKHYDALKARKEAPAVTDDLRKRYDDLKQQTPELPAGPPAGAGSGQGMR